MAWLHVETITKKRGEKSILFLLTSAQTMIIVEHNNIDPSKHLNRSRVHLNNVGDSFLEGNLLRALRI